MKTTILNKLLVLLLLLSIFPLLVLGFVAINNMNDMGKIASNNINQIGVTAVEDSTSALNELGETIITQKAQDVAKQLEIFIKENPEMTIEDLQNNELFSSLAVQPVGKTGYSAVHETNSLINRFHANPAVVNSDLHNLADRLPGFWSVLEKNEGGVEVSGYYDWQEADGSIEQKFMYIAVVDALTADDVQLGVAATTYISEFSEPVVAIEQKINSASNQMNQELSNLVNSVRMQLIIFLVIIILVVSVIGFFFSKSLSDPIKKLKNAADDVTNGEFDTKLPAPTNDEVGELTSSLEMLIMAFKIKVENEKQNSKKK